MAKSRLLLCLLAGPAILSVACGPPPKPVVTHDPSADEPPPTPEWLFVSETGPVAKSQKAECEKVFKAVVGEKACTGELCTHARNLGKEWLKKCRKTMSDQADEVTDVVDKASERVDLGADACIREGTGLLRTNDCGKAQACLQQSQKWITACGPRYATPLVVLMLTHLTERKFQEPTEVKFDTRSCKDLSDLVAKGVGCAGEEPCKQPADAVAAYMDRCNDGHAPLTLALAMADVLVGANKGVDPIPVDQETDKVTDAAFPLLTGDGKGMAIWACGERPATAAAYVAARSKCSPGEIIFARLDAGRRVRTLSVPHASDAEFQRLFPFLEIKGERDARADLPGFQRKVHEAVDSAKSGQGSAAAAQLAAAIITHAPAIVRSPEFRKVLGDADMFLSPALREWGKRKAAALGKVRDPVDQALFSGRSLQQPAADLRLDGSVLPGSWAPPAGLALSEWMPASFAAYRKETGKLETALKRKLSESKLEDLKVRITTEITACAAAAAAISKAEDAAAACLFKEADCSPAKAATLSSAADPHRERLAASQRNIALSLSGSVLPPSEVQRIESDKVSAGCLE
jgi:hypothetical protein